MSPMWPPEDGDMALEPPVKQVVPKMGPQYFEGPKKHKGHMARAWLDIMAWLQIQQPLESKADWKMLGPRTVSPLHFWSDSVGQATWCTLEGETKSIAPLPFFIADDLFVITSSNNLRSTCSTVPPTFFLWKFHLWETTSWDTSSRWNHQKFYAV